MVQTRRRRAAGKKRRERLDKLSKKLRRHAARPPSDPVLSAALTV
jgi:hypothetical protein